MKIGDRTPELEADHQRRALVHACMEGIEAFRRDAGMDDDSRGPRKDSGSRCWSWPRPFDMELEESAGSHQKTIWARKIQGARLLNVWRQTVTGAAAVPFVNAPSLSGWPESIMGDPEDPKTGFKASVDDQNRDIGAYWAHLFLWKLIDGMNATLVTKPADVPGDAYFVNIAAGQVLEPVMGSRDGRQVLSELRLSMPRSQRGEATNDPEKWPGSAVVPRVLLYQTAERHAETVDRETPKDGPPVFRCAELVKLRTGVEKWEWKGEWAPLEVRAGRNVVDIPFYAHYGRQVGPYRAWPAFEDTASLQAAHFRKNLDYDHRVFKDSRSILAVAGATAGEVQGAGPNKKAEMRGDVMFLPEKAIPYYFETTGAALQALRDDMRVIEEEIRIGNLRPMLSRPQPTRTATEVVVSQLGATSQLEALVVADFGPLRKSLEMKARLDGLDPEDGDIDIPHDFNVVGSEAVDRLWKGYIESGGILVSPEVMWPELRRAQGISEKINPTEEAARITARIQLASETDSPTTATEEP